MSVSHQIPDHIKRVARSVGYALWLDSSDSWFGLPVILRARLEPHQRAALVFMAIKSLDTEDAIMTVESAIGKGAGMPQTPFELDFLDQAAFWAERADPKEIEAYCLACFSAMPRTRQAAFLEFVQGRQVA